MNQRRQSKFDTLVADREETNSRPVDNDRAVQDHRLPGVQPAQRGEIPDLRGGQLRVGGEVEPLQGGGLLEASAAGAAGDGGGLPAGNLVQAQALQELEVSEFAGAGL